MSLARLAARPAGGPLAAFDPAARPPVDPAASVSEPFMSPKTDRKLVFHLLFNDACAFDKELAKSNLDFLLKGTIQGLS